MIPFDPSEIANWAETPDAKYQLPVLLRRLIMATVPMPSLLELPGGSSVNMPGWDGLLTIETGNAWVPPGKSAWELSCEKNYKRKANQDYDKRTANPKGVEMNDTTFMFVTPRKWNDKQNWEQAHREKGQWCNVRVLNADDLVAWLEQAPAVAMWFAKMIGKLPETGYLPLNEWWENWSSSSDPKISPELVIAGRQDQVQIIADWLTNKPASLYIQGRTRDEAIAFLSACAHTTKIEWSEALLSKAVVAKSAEAWKSFISHSLPLVLIRDFLEGNVSSQVAINRGHHVLIPLHESDDPIGKGLTLPRLDHDETIQELKAMGVSEVKAHQLIRSTGRRLSILRRRLINESGGVIPDWASPETSKSIVALILISQWDSNNESDKEIVAHVTGQAYEAIERDLISLILVEDSPITKIGSRWCFISHEEAWEMLAPQLTATDIDRFKETATETFNQISPEFNLPIEQRALASLTDEVLPHSRTIRKGIAQSLAIMGVHYDRIKHDRNAQHIPRQVLSDVLGDSGNWQVWATLNPELKVLAEASPEAFMDAVERDLDLESSPFKELFSQESDPIRGTISPHVGLLFALEILAWSQEYFSRVTKILARLAEIDSGGQITNRPIKDLQNLFLPWIRFSETSDTDRLETLKMLLHNHAIVWQPIIRAFNIQDANTNIRPSWRQWAQDCTRQPTWEECFNFRKEISALLLDNIGNDIGKWADFIKLLPEFHPETRQKTIQLLSCNVDELKRHSDCSILWEKLKNLLHLQRVELHEDWAIDTSGISTLDASDMSVLEAIYRELEPSDPALAYRYLFSGWPELPNGMTLGTPEADQRIGEERIRAVSITYEIGGVQAIQRLAEVVEEPHQVGEYVVRSIDSDLAFGVAFENLGSDEPKLRSMARGAFREFYRLSGWEMLERAISKAKTEGSIPQIIAYVYLAAPASGKTWQQLASEKQPVQTAYWNQLHPWRIRQDSNNYPEDVIFSAQKLIDFHRSYDLINYTIYEQIPDNIVVHALESLPYDIQLAQSAKPGFRISISMIASFFERLDQSENISDEVIARLEIPYLESLRIRRSNLAIYRLVTQEPSIFADLITWAFDECIDDQSSQNRTKIAISILQHLSGLPGLREDKTIDSERLFTWVSEARRLCKERNYTVIGDHYIGRLLANSPIGADEIWPCEPIRGLLDDIGSPEIGEGFLTGKSNLRGPTFRRFLDGGDQERSHANRYRQDSLKIAPQWPFTAQLLRDFAETYESEGRHLDDRAEWLDQFGD